MMKKTEFNDRLKELSKSDLYPFHMPGHKRQIKMEMDPYEIDITEIEGFDNLHHATGMIRHLQQQYAKLYGSKEAYLLINGSSGGILSAISASTNPKDHVLIARNSHKSVYHAAILNQLEVTYVYPKQMQYGINGSITPQQITEAYENDPLIKAVVITSPTYDGILSDVEKIAAIVHDRGGVLIVDAAHGAHFGLHESFPENAAARYADFAVLSLHKTLPSMTQTALLVHNTDRISSQKIQYWLNIYETSSPSYVFMASMEQCLSYCVHTKENEQRFYCYRKMLERFYHEVHNMKFLKVFCKENMEAFCYDKDPTKILISTRGIQGYSGEDLMKELRDSYHIECEMAAVDYVIALSSFMDTEEGMNRLSGSLRRIDQRLASIKQTIADDKPEHIQILYQPRQKCYELYEMEQKKGQTVSIQESEGRVSKEFCYLYPPGIPIIAPGEMIPPGFAKEIEGIKEAKMEVNGLSDYSSKTIKVIENSGR